jgi:GMP synthase (glutamine-hydrolysing)
MSSRVLILDFGSQTTQLIARRVRELEVYCEIRPFNIDVATVKEYAPDALILSGGPASVHAEGTPRLDEGIWDLELPTLGICYGMQAMVQHHGGQITAADHREFGPAYVDAAGDDVGPLLKGIQLPTKVWMSHGDQATRLPNGFFCYGKSDTCPNAVIGDPKRKLYGVQFHPEVVHTDEGTRILSDFLDAVGLTRDWKMESFVDQQCEAICAQVGDDHVVLGLSGGVDSTVAAAIIRRAIGDQLTCVYVDHGLHRHAEVEEVEALFKEHFGEGLIVARAADRFVGALADIVDPEKKRKVIGHTFIEVFQEQAEQMATPARFLGQGTLYPDVVESVSAHGGPSAVIKSHHNVGGLPEQMHLKLVEPLRQLFKDEVRLLGDELGLPKHWVERQPFPGPGLAIRILGAVTSERLEVLRRADRIVREEIDAVRKELPIEPWQWFAVLLPVQSVGVMGDARTYEDTVAVRCVESRDGMTAHWSYLPHEVLERMSARIINEVRGVNRVVYDISSKPPSTIEWE